MKQVRARTQVKNQLHALAISQGVCRKGKLWSAKGSERTGEPGAVALGGAAAERVAGVAGPPGRAGAGAGPGGGRSRARARGGGAVAHPSGSGHGGGPGLCADAWDRSSASSNSRKLVSYWGLNPRENS